MTRPKDEGSDTLEYCRATVDLEGNLTMVYKWSHLKVRGSLSHDENVLDWSDDDIAGLVAALIGCSDEDAERIEVLR